MRRKLDGVETWVPVYQALNLALVNEFALEEVWPMVDQYLLLAGLPERSMPVAAERAISRRQALEAQTERDARELRDTLERQARELREVHEHALKERAWRQNTPPPWGSRAAKQQEIERVRREIAARKKAREG